MQESKDMHNTLPPRLVYYIDNGDGSRIELSAQDYLNHLKSEVEKAEFTLRRGIAEREIADAFQRKAQTLLWGLSEIRWALGSPQIDDNKSEMFSNERTPVKSAFPGEEQKGVLRVHYIKLLEQYMKFVKQLTE